MPGLSGTEAQPALQALVIATIDWVRAYLGPPGEPAMTVCPFDDIGAGPGGAMIRDASLPSRRLLEARGLPRDPAIRAGIAVPSNAPLLARQA
jgi:hypothetical protein